MIGVISKTEQRATVEEFFQLFKVPWEFYQKDRKYRALIITEPSATPPPAALNLLFFSAPCRTDMENRIQLLPADRGGTVFVSTPHGRLPIKTDLSLFLDCSEPIIETTDDMVAGYRIRSDDQTIIRIGFDLFAEVDDLLSGGQSVEHASCPSVETLISMMRQLILEAGVPLLEIPPVPPGFKFISCLTHDVDFMGIRDHFIDRSLLGFIYRALFSYSLDDLKSKNGLKKIFRNIGALFSLPAIYLGMKADIWNQLDRYSEIEGDRKSTFYFLPFKGKPGDRMPGCSGNTKPPGWRSSRYDIKNLKTSINTLLKKGHEISLHGLDAWCSSEKGQNESNVIRQVTGQDKLGVRMHWLYFSEESPETLEHAGFLYDSTLGYNETVGFRSGTSQVYRLPKCSDILELPLHIQDTAMLYRGRMNLSESDAFTLCEELISKLRTFGGVLTVNWHQRSLGPERNWDEFYLRLLASLDSENVWFATGIQAVSWFQKRRSASFVRTSGSDSTFRLVSSYSSETDLPDLTIRHHPPIQSSNPVVPCPDSELHYSDTKWSGSGEIILTI